jgi:ABC-type transporter Mla subunit MlaD
MKKESLKELLERLDEQSAQFSSHMAEANRFFDTALKKTEALLAREEKELHATIQKVKSALKNFSRDKEKGGKQ